MLNTQAPEKADLRDDGSVVVHSIFHTIQGEGPFAGYPAIFVRLAGCNLQCPLCDTEYTDHRLRMGPNHIGREIGMVGHDWMSKNTPADQPVVGSNTNLIVITGGEPFRQNIGPLVRHLLGMGLLVQIETNGTLYPKQSFPFQNEALTIVCSPKTSVVNKLLLPHINALKYVASAESLGPDGLPTHALEHPNAKGLYRPPSEWDGFIYLQPVDEKDETKNAANLSAVVKSCMRYGYRLCLQVHKYIGVD